MSVGSDKPAAGGSSGGGAESKDTEESTFTPQPADAAAGPASRSRIAVPLVVLVFGLLLTGLGLIAYFAFATGENRSVTALIPLFWGLPICACAVFTLVADKSTSRGFDLFSVLESVCCLDLDVP